ncbi:hydrogenase maturation protease [Thiosocius teredinicola]|uniref:hydrogenase maturation protease n=1 Tax=Thiosocius teredinicola TaxID=1973002 RepID=UPI000990D798
MAFERSHVICFGNELHGDDGFGPAVFAALDARQLPDSVRLFRADVSGLSAINCFANCERALVIDALQGYGPAGSVHALNRDDVLVEQSLSGHGAGVGAVLELLPSALPSLPDVDVIGAEVERVAAFEPGLTPCVAAAVPLVVEQVVRWLNND